MTAEPNDDELEARLIELFDQLDLEAKERVLEKLEAIVDQDLEAQGWSVLGFTADARSLFNFQEETDDD